MARTLFVTVSAVMLVIAAVVTYYNGTGFGEKYLVDWLDILIFPTVVVGSIFWLDSKQKDREQAAEIAQRDHEFRLEEQQRRREIEIEEQRAQADALQAYLDSMGELMLKEGLLHSQEDSEARLLARARTLTILDRIGPALKRSVLLFLHEAKLINTEQPVISLKGANLREADLNHASLSGANLHEAILAGADLSHAVLNIEGLTRLLHGSLRAEHQPITDQGTSPRYILQTCNLEGANLGEADLRDANLQGSILVGVNDLVGADLTEANLRGADLRNADLTWVVGLSQEQIEVASGDHTTQLPDYLQRPELWSKSIENDQMESSGNATA